MKVYEMNYRLYRQKMIRDAAVMHIPILGEFGLTARCNLHCDMCYVVDSHAQDLSTETWITIFKQAVEAGLVFAILTGGEFFVRQDAILLYKTLYDLGVRITLFTNGTDITQTIADELEKRPPEMVLISLYGASNETYQKVTKYKQGFDRLKEGITLLKSHHIKVMLRTLPLQALYHDLDDMIAFAKKQDLTLNYLRYIGPSRSGLNQASSLRLSPELLIEFEAKLQNAFGYESALSFTTSTEDATCAALKSGYFISHKGMMQPCAMAYTPTKSVINEDFKQVFDTLALELRAIERFDLCRTCSHQASCMQCYARRMLETGSQSCPPYLKAYAKLKGSD
jgi:radical SAM protein with 4Fe4S-binding SPASM domain